MKKQAKLNLLYKQITKLNINVFYTFKVLRFKKKKWGKFLWCFINDLKLSKYKKYKIIDQYKFLINKKNKLEISYKNNYYKKYFIIFNSFFGKLTTNFYKKYKNNYYKKYFKILPFLESRLDHVLYRSKISCSLRLARQLVVHGFVYVNKIIVKNKSFILKPGDLISLDWLLLEKYKFSLICSLSWPLPSTENLIINFKTFEIVFLGHLNKEKSFIFYYPFYFKLYKVFN